MKLGNKYNLQLSDKEYIILEDLLNMASDGWYVEDTFNDKVFKTHKEQEDKTVKLLVKLMQLKK